MKATIVHESRGRMRLRLKQKTMTLRQADLLEAWLRSQPWTREAVVHERTGCVILTYAGKRETVLSSLAGFTWAGAEERITLPSHSTRELNRAFQEKLVSKVTMKAAAALFLPAPLRIARVVWHMIPFLGKGLRCLWRRQIKVELLDALSIGISACRRDFGTAGMVMFLLEIGELLEDWTRKKSVADLAESLSLHVDRVWLKTPAGEVLTPIGQIQPGDQVVARAGGIIPLDGVVAEGEVTVNQASLTGESVPVAKRSGGAVYAGTVVEEGECVLEVKQVSGQGRYDQIVEMIQRSEQLKSAAEAKASSLADKLVPYTFAGSLISLALTRNVTRAPTPTPAPGWQRSSPSTARRRRRCSVWPPAWRSTSLTPWPTPWWRRPNAGACAMRNAMLRWSIWWPMASPAPWTGSRCASAVPTSSSRTRSA